jgi:Zn-dependent peptidase ImmA (M78 family)
MRSAGIFEARRAARALVTRLGITSAEHIAIEAIVKRVVAQLGYRVRIVSGPLDGADSQMIRKPGEVVIIVSERLEADARRFAIAHELGHLLLDHPLLPPHRIGGPPRRSPEHVRDYEAEANAFASELTMPYELVHGWCDGAPVTLEPAWRIKHAFGVSILAAAIRVTELSLEPCAAVFSARRRVIWCAESATSPPIERGRTVAETSMASGFWDRGAVFDAPADVPASAWFETDVVELAIVEHATASHEFRTVLSMLWVPEPAAALLRVVPLRTSGAHA